MEQELQEVESLIEEGDLARAQVLCKQLLQKHPTNAHAHERMGDIMRKRYMWEEAAEWYALAAQLQDSEALRAKRADVLQRAKESRRGGVEPHLVDEDTTSRMTLWIGLGAAAMLLVIAAIAFSISSVTTPATDKPKKTSASTRASASVRNEVSRANSSARSGIPSGRSS